MLEVENESNYMNKSPRRTSGEQNMTRGAVSWYRNTVKKKVNPSEG